jgi:hypothetical protein
MAARRRWLFHDETVQFKAWRVFETFERHVDSAIRNEPREGNTDVDGFGNPLVE